MRILTSDSPSPSSLCPFSWLLIRPFDSSAPVPGTSVCILSVHVNNLHCELLYLYPHPDNILDQVNNIDAHHGHAAWSWLFKLHLFISYDITIRGAELSKLGQIDVWHWAWLLLVMPWLWLAGLKSQDWSWHKKHHWAWVPFPVNQPALKLAQKATLIL